jgi:hypothetical protein
LPMDEDEEEDDEEEVNLLFNKINWNIIFLLVWKWWRRTRNSL